MPSARTARERAREQITEEILTSARRQLTAVGPGELSLRAVARDVGMVSSAVYRYVSSRDELLTRLLVLAYDELGAAAEDADAAVTDRDDTRGRWMATCRAVRSWAIDHPGDYALLYGSPVPGYVAPPETIGPATRGTVVLIGIVAQSHRTGSVDLLLPASDPELEDLLGDALAFVRDHGLSADVPPELVARTIRAWTAVFGTISFELFGHLVGSVTDTSRWFDVVAQRLADDLGLA